MTTDAALPPPIERLLGELAADFGLSDIADQFRVAFRALEAECAGNWHASQCMSALGLVAAQSRPLRDRLTDIFEIIAAPGSVVVKIRMDATND